MSELINNAEKRKDLLKHMIRQLHEGEAPEAVRKQLLNMLGKVPYNDVVEVEQELIAEGLPEEEILKLCDIHTAAMKGAIETEDAADAPPGHPVHTFIQENKALAGEIALVKKLHMQLALMEDEDDATEIVGQLRVRFGTLADVEKHYQRKENLLFPYLEQKEITGPPKVMWGKHDEVREMLKGAFEALKAADKATAAEAQSMFELVLKPVIDAIEEMIYKEENILLPMTLEKLDESEWYHIYQQSNEIGYCIYDPTDEWKPDVAAEAPEGATQDEGRVQLPSGSMTPTELNAILNTIPFDLTFVDKDDRVRYFTQGRERIFQRNRAIIGREVQMCHPPSSVHIVEQILDDFRSGRQDHAPFWIELHGKFIHIEYFALRDKDGEYLGTLEVSQDLTHKRSLTGEQRLLNYGDKEKA